MSTETLNLTSFPAVSLPERLRCYSCMQENARMSEISREGGGTYNVPSRRVVGVERFRERGKGGGIETGKGHL